MIDSLHGLQLVRKTIKGLACLPEIPDFLPVEDLQGSDLFSSLLYCAVGNPLTSLAEGLMASPLSPQIVLSGRRIRSCLLVRGTTLLLKNLGYRLQIAQNRISHVVAPNRANVFLQEE